MLGVMTDHDLVDAIDRIVLAGIALTARALTETSGPDLTFPQWRVIVVLGESEEGATVSEVAGRIGVTLPATSRQLHRMERRGLVEIAPDERDRRAARARLTASGAHIRELILVYRRERIRQTISDAGTTRADVAKLERIADALNKFV
jgi:DNA-binding MarR family transcriptional regulator